MLISAAWLNRCLDPGDLSVEALEEALERAGFPIEEREPLDDGDMRLDVEITSNRGDCLCHMGLAREVAAQTGRRLVSPPILQTDRPRQSDQAASDVTSVDNRVPDVCPRFTARVIRGAKVGPSPAWLASALESVGQRPINNVVDASNYILFETGHPTHTFDLNTLSEKRIVVRYAHKDEPLTTLDERKVALREDELVVADAQRAVSLAGVIGGLETAVTEKTEDVLLEAATWNPATIRRAARRLRITTDAGHRFERIVDPRTVHAAAERLAALICELTGGELLEGAIDQGAPAEPKTVIDLRTHRCDDLLGVVIPPAEQAASLERLGVDVEQRQDGSVLRCGAPPFRPDLTREVDLIEEVARVHGLDRIPIEEKIHVEVKPPQASEAAMREVARALTGLGFYETVTFSFVSEADAARWTPPGMRALKVDEERRKDEPALRPSVIPSLLRCRKVNEDAGAEPGLRFFETSAVFAETDGGETIENMNLALLADAPDLQGGVRAVRGAVEAVAHALGGPAVELSVETAPPVFKAMGEGAFGLITLNGSHLGYLGVPTDEARRAHGLETPVVAAEVNLPALVGLYPPRARVTPPPAFPGIERDLSLVLDEAVPWADVRSAVWSAHPEHLAAVDFVTVFRGKQVGKGKKSLTLRLRFRNPQRTLRHEEVDPQVEAVVNALRQSVGGELRG